MIRKRSETEDGVALTQGGLIWARHFNNQPAGVVACQQADLDYVGPTRAGNEEVMADVPADCPGCRSETRLQ